jgi:hypothetical protein
MTTERQQGESTTPEPTKADPAPPGPASSAASARPMIPRQPGPSEASRAEAIGAAAKPAESDAEKPAGAADSGRAEPPPAIKPTRRFRLFSRRKAAPSVVAVTAKGVASVKPDVSGGTSAKPGQAGALAGSPVSTKTDLPVVEDPLKTDQKAKRTEPLPTERPPGVPPDPWTAFATTTERAPGPIRRSLRVLKRGLLHEYAVVIMGGLLLAVALTWPTLRYPMHTLPQDAWDPARQAWQIAWGGHILLTDPVRLWQSNAFYPESNSFAFGDSLLGYAPFGMLGEGPVAATLRYNILFVLAHALLAIGGYALVRQLGAGRTGATVAAVAFAYAPWRLAQEGHLDIVSAGGIPLALAMIAHGHGWSMRRGLRSGRRGIGWTAVGWLIAAWQVSLGFSLGLPFLYVLGGLLLVLLVGVPIRRWRRPASRPVLGWPLLFTDLLGALITAGVAALIAVPYFKASTAANSVAEIKFFSPPLRSLLIGPAESRIWGSPHAVPRSSLTWPAEMTLLPGFVLYALALAGLAFSIWTLRQRLLLLAALTVSIILTLGTNFFDGRWTYLPLFGHLPASLGVRIPGRLMLWTTLLLAVLAAGAVAEFVRRAEHLSELRIPPWPGPWLRLATFVPLALVLLEGWNATAHPVVPAQPTAMRTVTNPMLVLPTSALADQTVMLWSTSRFQPVANGSGGFAAVRQAQLRGKVANFPDIGSIEYLRSVNITTVLLIRSQTPGTSWERAGDIPVDTLGIQREDLDDAVVFHLTPQPTS